MSKTRDYTQEEFKKAVGDTPYLSNITNELGIEATTARSKLKNWALANPAEYSAARATIYEQVVTQMVEEGHRTIWLFLAKGLKPDGEQIKIKGADWNPGLPKSQISKLANGYSASILEAFSSIMSVVFPDDYRKLADDKQLTFAQMDVMRPPTASAAAPTV